jgi:hypothetical protein
MIGATRQEEILNSLEMTEMMQSDWITGHHRVIETDLRPEQERKDSHLTIPFGKKKSIDYMFRKIIECT